MDTECIEITNLEDGRTNHMSNGLETPSKVISSHETNDGDHPNLHPRIGMEFNNINDVKEFYISFAKKEGFGIRTRTTKENFCTLVCSNEGKHTTKSSNEDEYNVSMGTKKKTSTSRTDCKALLSVSKAWKRSKWSIISFSNDHNHAMLSPKSVNYLRCHKKMGMPARSLVEKFDEEGIPTGKVAKMFNSGDETEKSFEWLFLTWLKAMSGKSPVSIITDQDLAMKTAIANVFPNTRHRLCLWHIRRKFAEKLSHIYHKKSPFKKELKSCIRESPSIEDFEENWERILVAYDLKANQWLQGLYKIRESWVPIYNRSTFFAGMNTTQRSESINAFFDSFVNSSTILQDFVVKFEKAVDSRYEKQKREDFESRHRSRLSGIKSKIEEHAASIYTRTMFGKFHDELAQILQFKKEKIEKNGSQYTYKVSSCYDSRDTFIVHVDLETKVAKCCCQLFEFMGILCRHILVIFQAKNVVNIPSNYILKRWTKDAIKGSEFDENGGKNSIENNSSATLRSIHVHTQANLLSDLAAKSPILHEMISDGMKQLYDRALARKNELRIEDGITPLEPSSENLTSEPLNVSVELDIKDPRGSQTKGRKKDVTRETQHGRIKSSIELSINRSQAKRRSCQLCGEHGHNRRGEVANKRQVTILLIDGDGLVLTSEVMS
ncbi:protein FAR1-RELATED SEQUENCE 5-like [Medicago truncatula]|uniref:protein FAR1-RELATED SEQUENCE 5-like n=1 Tax=Medicago truncatula TaxID=3880 RepID=UPI001967FD5C|nr:protein FAR1-RELATED SEQUENCE 5-like [Medicago truncatula]